MLPPEGSTCYDQHPTWHVRLHLLVDSAGIKMLGEGKWKTKTHRVEYRRQWRKVHLSIDAETLEIRAIKVTDNGVGDAPMLPELLSQIPPEEPLLSVSGDGAYDTKVCHEAIARRQAAVIIPTQRNDKPWKDKHPGHRLVMRFYVRLATSVEMERLPPAQPS